MAKLKTLMSFSEPKPVEPLRKALNGWLTEWYEARVLAHGSPVQTVARFNKAAEFNPGLKVEAAKRYAEIKDIPDDRCFISKTQREFLTKVIDHAQQTS